MKIAIIVLFGLVACSNATPLITVPQGYKTCASDYDCNRGYYCGFVKLNTYAVCRAARDPNYDPLDATNPFH
jgi:hypothetical protein